MRSSTILPRRRVGACSPSTHLIASTTLDLPHPLGPTTAVIPGAKPIVVESRKDLKPSNSRLLRRMLSSPPPHHHSQNLIAKYPQRIKSAPPTYRVSGDPQPHQIVDFRRGGLPTRDRLILDQLGVPVRAIHLRQIRHPFAV